MSDHEIPEQAGGTMAIPGAAMVLGAAGVLPQVAALVAVLAGDPAWTFGAQALAYAYAAIIFSFLGGLWWGLAARERAAPQWVYAAAVVPSLIALASAVPWAIGADWPGPSLILLGLFILISPLVDRVLVRERLAPLWWMRLRVPLSIALGTLTLATGLLS